jgi:hypothetical protein
MNISTAALIVLGMLALVFYLYVGYPILLVLLGPCSGAKDTIEGLHPRVSLIISAYNEEDVIHESCSIV